MKLRHLLKSAYAWVGRSFSLTDHDALKGWGGTTDAGKAVTEVTAMQTSAVFACVRVLAESIGALTWSIYRRDKNGNAEQSDHALTEVLVHSPNADMTAVEFREALTVNLALQGNAYCERNTSASGRVTSLYPLLAGQVTPRRREDGSIEYLVADRGKTEILPREKIWHVKGFGATGLVGFSPIGYLRQAVGLALATESFGSKFFGQGGTTSGIITVPDFLEPEQRKVARDIIAQKYEGLGNAHKFMLLEGGMTFNSVSMPLEDAQFLETRRFQVNEICRIYRIPPHLVADLERATFSNIEHLTQDFVTFTLMPWLRRFEDSVSKWLLPPGDRGRFFLRFNVESLLRGDSDARAKFYASMLQNGVYSRNEVRALENRNRVDGSGMDDYTVQSNMAPIDALAALLAGKTAVQTPAPAGPTKTADVQNIIVNLPESVKHQLQTRIDVPGLKDLADQMRASTDAASQRSAELVAQVTKVVEAAGRPRKAIFDTHGNPIGSIPVDSLH